MMRKDDPAPVCADAIKLASMICGQKIWLILCDACFSALLHGSVKTVTHQICIVRYIRQHKMKHQAVAVEQVSDQLQLQAIPTQVHVNQPRHDVRSRAHGQQPAAIKQSSREQRPQSHALTFE